MRKMPSRHPSHTTAAEADAPAAGGQVTGVRLPPAMRDQLMREAVGNHRSLSQEIIQRLSMTLEDKRSASANVRAGNQYKVEEGQNALSALTPAEHALLDHFAQLSAEKQLALITFLKKT